MKPTLIEDGKFQGKKLYHRRYELGLSLIQVAILCHRTPSTIQFWETGQRHPKAASLKLLSEALHVKPIYFFTS